LPGGLRRPDRSHSRRVCRFVWYDESFQTGIVKDCSLEGSSDPEGVENVPLDIQVSNYGLRVPVLEPH
jgi:hypothetical protein